VIAYVTGFDKFDISQPYTLRPRIGLHAVNQKLRAYKIIRVIDIIIFRLYLNLPFYITFYSLNHNIYNIIKILKLILKIAPGRFKIVFSATTFAITAVNGRALEKTWVESSRACNGIQEFND
jgi:hypothetical protein